MQSDKEFGLLGRDLLPKHGVVNITAKHLPAVKGYKAHMKLIPATQPMFCKARKNTPTSSTQGHREVGTNGQTRHP